MVKVHSSCNIFNIYIFSLPAGLAMEMLEHSPRCVRKIYVKNERAGFTKIGYLFFYSSFYAKYRKNCLRSDYRSHRSRYICFLRKI